MFQSIRLGEKCAAFPLLINDFLQKMKKFQQTKIFRQFIFDSAMNGTKIFRENFTYRPTSLKEISFFLCYWLKFTDFNSLTLALRRLLNSRTVGNIDNLFPFTSLCTSVPIKCCILCHYYYLKSFIKFFHMCEQRKRLKLINVTITEYRLYVPLVNFSIWKI